MPACADPSCFCLFCCSQLPLLLLLLRSLHFSHPYCAPTCRRARAVTSAGLKYTAVSSKEEDGELEGGSASPGTSDLSKHAKPAASD